MLSGLIFIVKRKIFSSSLHVLVADICEPRLCVSIFVSNRTRPMPLASSRRCCRRDVTRRYLPGPLSCGPRRRRRFHRRSRLHRHRGDLVFSSSAACGYRPLSMESATGRIVVIIFIRGASAVSIIIIDYYLV